MFNSVALLRYFEEHQTLPHVSQYHKEDYPQHCLLVISEILKRTTDSAIIIAACLHDIAKPRTQGYNQRNEPCFIGHETVNDEELSQFLSYDDSRYARVKALILCHMVPYRLHEAKDYDKSFRKSCRKNLKLGNLDFEVTDELIRDVIVLHEADNAGTIRDVSDLSSVEDRCKKARAYLMNCDL